MEPAVSYARVSGEFQIDKGGFHRQLKTINDFARENKYKIESVYKEEGVSGGTDFASRPAFSEMLNDLLANGCRIIIIERLDRLSREFAIQNSILAFLATKGLTLISADTGEDVTKAMQSDPMRRAIIQIQGIFSELDKNLIISKLRRGKEAKASKIKEIIKTKGKKAIEAKQLCVDGKTPKIGHRHRISDHDLLKKIKSLKRKKLNFYKITKELKKLGFQNSKGNPYQLGQVQRITASPEFKRI